MGFTPTDQHAVFGVVSALLHASNLTFKSAGEVECALDMDNPHVQFVVDLLGISTKGLNHALCYDEIVVRGETHRKVLSKDQAEKGIEALIKATYGAMFTYLVRRINASVASHTEGAVTGSVVKTPRSSRRGDAAKEASIGILVSLRIGT
jgi:myosin-5